MIECNYPSHHKKILSNESGENGILSGFQTAPGDHKSVTKNIALLSNLFFILFIVINAGKLPAAYAAQAPPLSFAQKRYRVSMKSAITLDPYFRKGIQDGNDKVRILFSGKTGATPVFADTIDVALRLSGGHTWGAIRSAQWTTTRVANDTLTITLGTNATIVPRDVISLDGSTIKDFFGKGMRGSITLKGDFALYLPPGVEAYWRMDGVDCELGIGDCELTAIDSAGSHNGVLLNGPVWEEDGEIGGSLRFDGEDDRVTGEFAVDFGGRLSLEAWFKSPGGSREMAGIIELSSATFKSESAIVLQSTGVLQAWTGCRRPGQPRGKVVSTDTYNDNEWHHVVYTFDGMKGRLYVDGKTVAVSGKEPCLKIAKPEHFSIGSSYSHTDNTFNGLIDEALVYKLPLKADDVRSRWGGYHIAAFADDRSKGGAGIQTGDRVNIIFDGPTNGALVDNATIDAILELDDLHTWQGRNSPGIKTALWSTKKYKNDTLTITLNNPEHSMYPDVSEDDTISINSRLSTFHSQFSGPFLGTPYRPFSTSVKIAGSFGDDLPSTPVSSWAFDETSGEVAYDSTGRYHGRLMNNPDRIFPGMFKSGLDFNGPDTAMQVGHIDPNALGVPGEWSVEAWFRAPLPQTYSGNVLAGAADYHVMVDRSGEFGTYNSSAVKFAGSGFNVNNLSTGWHQVIAVGNKRETTFYIDGQAVGKAAYKSRKAINNIGNSRAGGQQFGVVDSITIYANVLSSDDVRERYTVFLKDALAKDTSRDGDGVQDGDSVIITFTGATEGTAIDENSIDKALPLPNKHSWLGENGIGGAIWSSAAFPNDTLTIILKNGATVEAGDIVRVADTGIIKNISGKPVEDIVSITGSFGANLLSGAVAFWRFDTESGDVVYDRLGNHNGVLLNDPVWALNGGVLKNALYFDGQGAHVGIGEDNAIPVSTGALSIELWFKTSSPTRQYLFARSNERGYQYELHINPNGSLSGNIYNAARTSSTGVNTANGIGGDWSDGEWHHVVFTFASTASGGKGYANIYLDGQPAVDGSYSSRLADIDTAPGHNVYLGYSAHNPSVFFQGSIDEAVFYDRAATPSEIFTRYVEIGMKGAVAQGTGGGGEGPNGNDRVIIRFCGGTNGPAINAGNIDTVLSLDSGHSWLDGRKKIGNAVWSGSGFDNDTLIIELTENDGHASLDVGDMIALDGTIISVVDNLPLIGHTKITGTFGSHAKAQSASAKDTSGRGAGIQAHDTVVIMFDGQTDGPAVTGENIDSLLSLSNNHSWLDGDGKIVSAVWGKSVFPYDSLTITMGGPAGDGKGPDLPTITVHDTILLDGTIKDEYGNPVMGKVALAGTFGKETEVEKPETKMRENKRAVAQSVGETDRADTPLVSWDFSKNDDRTADGVVLKADLTLPAEWTIETWFTYPFPPVPPLERQLRFTFAAGSGEHIMITANNERPGIFSGNDYYHVSGFTMKRLLPGLHQLVAVGTGGEGRKGTTVFYIDGNRIGSVNFKEHSPVKYIGNNAAGSGRSGSVLKKAMVYSTALEPETIRKHYGVRPKTAFAYRVSGRDAYPMGGNRVVIRFDGATNGADISDSGLLSGVLNPQPAIKKAVWSSMDYPDDTLTLYLSEGEKANPPVFTGNAITFGGGAITALNGGKPVDGSANLRGSFDITLAEDAIAYWSFDDWTGPGIFDELGGAAATKAGRISEAPGMYNTSGIRINGRGASVQLHNDIALTDEWTVMAWFQYPLADTAADNVLIQTTEKGDAIAVTTQGNSQKVGILIGSKDSDRLFMASDYDMTELPEGWHLLAAVSKGGEGTDGATDFYINGKQAGNTISYKVSGVLKYIGNTGQGRRSWGTLDEFSLYRRALDQGEIRRYYGTKPAAAYAHDASSGRFGVQTGDRVIVFFNGETNGATIDNTNIDTALALNNSHSWLDGSGNIGSALWRSSRYANDTLVITLSAADGVPDINRGDTMTFDGATIRDLNRGITGSVPVQGDFDGAVALYMIDQHFPRWAEKYTEPAVRLIDKNEQYLTIKENDDFKLLDYTIEARIKAPASISPGTGMPIISLESRGPDSYYVYMYLNNKGALVHCDSAMNVKKKGTNNEQEQKGDKSCITVLSAERTLTDGKWHSVVVVKDTGWDTFTFYIDGDNVKVVDGFFGPEQYHIDGIRVGREKGKKSREVERELFKGIIDYIVVYDYALTEEQALHHYSPLRIIAEAKNRSGSNTSGIQPGDAVEIMFGRKTEGKDIDTNNIDTALILSAGHTWGHIRSADWTTTDMENDTLSIILGENAKIAVGDRIRFGTIITDFSGDPVSGSVVIGGTFDADLPSGAIAYWNFDDGIGSIAADMISGYDGTVSGAWLSDRGETGRFRDGLLFEGKNNYVSFDPGVPLGHEWSVELWLKLPLRRNSSKMWTLASFNAEIQQIMVKEGKGDDKYYMGVYYRRGGQQKGPFFSSGYAINALPNGWHHIAAVGRDGQTIFYTDGFQRGRVDFMPTEDIIHIGNGIWKNGFKNASGRIDDVVIYNRALSAKEILKRARR